MTVRRSLAPDFDDDELKALVGLALDLRWSWSNDEDAIWGPLNPELWELTNSPWVVLQTTSLRKLRTAAAEPEFRERLRAALARVERYEAAPTWFSAAHPDAALTCAAYFSMEFMLSEALPIYSGGLGNVAGDQLKAASDLGVPVVGVGLLYQQGYFRQIIDAKGEQLALYPYNDPSQLPVTPVRDADGEWVRVDVMLPGGRVWLRAWQAKVGRSTLYLLDTNDPANAPVYRGISGELYGGASEMRLTQEIVLGIGGWRLLRALGMRPEVCHLNEGHAAFAVLERAATYMEETGKPFDVALATTRAGNLFTTHTPVPAGFDRFSPALVEQYLGAYARERLGIGLDELLALGRENPENSGEPLTMAYLALRGSRGVNGVSRLHGAVSRRIFQPLFPRWPEADVPVGSVTNGVHVPSWDSARADALWERACGPDRWNGQCDMAESIRGLSDEELWALRADGRSELVEYARKRLARQLSAAGASEEELAAAATTFDPNALTLCFARRFATYKRPTLLLHDPERLVRLLTNAERPVQLLVAGKAHPLDENGRAMIRVWTEFVRRPDVRGRVAFIGDYDMLLTSHLVQGSDVWINTPRRPWEASGTSGMKVLSNGGLNLSEIDGWWAEAAAPEVGWAFGDGAEHGEDPAWDAHEAEALYELLEREVVPSFYDRDERGIPHAWVSRVRESMARLTPQFAADRTVREYTGAYYLSAAEAYLARSADGGALGAELAEWRTKLARDWPEAPFGEVRAETIDDRHHVRIDVRLGDLDPSSVRVELYADPSGGLGAERYVMELEEGSAGVYGAWIPATRPVAEYTPRLVAYHPSAAVPLEAPEIAWSR